MEGGSFLEVYEERNDTLSPWLRSFYYEDGENHNYLATWLQLVWLVTLALGMVSGAALFFGGRQTPEEAGHESVLILMLSVVGITAFELLCEARARYLFIYAPVYVILAAMGWKALRDASLRRVKAGMKRSKI
jgi:hypothetical protein